METLVSRATARATAQKPTGLAKIWQKIKKVFRQQSRSTRRKERLKEHGAVFLEHDSKVKTREGVTFHLPGNIARGTDIRVIMELFCGGDYVFRIGKNENIIVFDMGMNIGAASLYFATIENVTTVYSFEPFTPTYNKALENINLNPDLARKIKVFNFGLGKKNETLEIPYCRDFAGDMSTTIDRLEYDNEYHELPRVVEKVEVKDAAEVLAPILGSLPTESIVLKIDTEGAEFDILESLDSAFLLKKVDYIMMEYHFRSPQPLEDILTNNGFIVTYRHLYREGDQNGVMYAANVRRR